MRHLAIALRLTAYGLATGVAIAIAADLINDLQNRNTRHG